MEKISVDPYLFFHGDCHEAMEFYKSIFGGQVEYSMHDDVPDGAQEGMSGKVMHASLTGGDVNLMASDVPASENLGTGKISISLSGTDDPKLRAMFEGLSVGGSNLHPLKTESWGDTFGAVVDKYGVSWMTNIGTDK